MRCSQTHVPVPVPVPVALVSISYISHGCDKIPGLKEEEFVAHSLRVTSILAGKEGLLVE